MQIESFKGVARVVHQIVVQHSPRVHLQAEVNGVLVIPVRNATMPERIIKFVSVEDNPIQPERTDPILPPALRPGAKIPPDAPVVKERMGPAILNKGIYQIEYLFAVKSETVKSCLPEPSTLTFIKKASEAKISEQIKR